MIKPLKNSVLVLPEPKEDISPGGIAIVSNRPKKGPKRGTVIAVGPGELFSNGKQIELDVKPNDTVIYSSHVGVELTSDGIEYLLLDYTHLLAKVINE